MRETPSLNVLLTRRDEHGWPSIVLRSRGYDRSAGRGLAPFAYIAGLSKKRRHGGHTRGLERAQLIRGNPALKSTVRRSDQTRPAVLTNDLSNVAVGVDHRLAVHALCERLRGGQCRHCYDNEGGENWCADHRTAPQSGKPSALIVSRSGP